MRKSLESGLIHAMRAFLRVVDAGSFTAAAEQLDLTVSQVSRLVSELERRLGAKLLQRTTHQRSLTETGTEYVARCREILALIDEAEANAAGTVSKPQGRLRVQSMASFGHHYIAPMLGEFCANYPQLTVDYSTSQYFPDLLAQGVDVGLYLAESLSDSGFVARRIGTTFSVVCASPSYIEQHGEPNSPAELHKHACLRLVNSSMTPDWQLTDSNGDTQKMLLSGRLIADTPELLLKVAIQGGGLTLLPLFSVIDAVRDGSLRRVLPDWQSPVIGIHALLPSRQFIDAKTRALLDWLDDCIAPRISQDTEFFTKS